MKRLALTVVTVLAVTTVSLGQCNCLFSFAAYFNAVSFSNQSSVSNAHYFWNFGDGTGSNFVNPVHTFPSNGNYLVTLFAEDTINNCSSYYECWVNATKYSNAPCQPEISDSIANDNLYIYNTSPNCNGYNMAYSGGPSCGRTPNLMPIGLGGWDVPWHIVCNGRYYDNNRNLQGMAYKTVYYHNYSSSHNYGNCSANFEFVAVSKDSSQERILFTAMNKKAKSYKWMITGFGNPIISYNDTVSQSYTFGLYCPWLVGLMTEDSSGCRDTVYQDIMIDDSSNTVLNVHSIKNENLKLDVYPNPTSQIVTVQLQSEKQQNIIFNVYNLLGEPVYSNIIKEPTGLINQKISLSSLPNGTYILKVSTENSIYHQEIIKLQ